MSIVLVGSTSGSCTLQEQAVAGNTVLTLPTTSGTIITTASAGGVSQSMLASGVAGNGPAFSVYSNSSQNLSNSTATKIVLTIEDFDTANCFDTSTYRFTPNVAGYYQFNAAININGTTGNNYIAQLWKNGAEAKRGMQISPNSVGNTQVCVSSILYMNGTTDYAEFYGFQSSGSTQGTFGGAAYAYFNGAMVRAA